MTFEAISKIILDIFESQDVQLDKVVSNYVRVGKKDVKHVYEDVLDTLELIYNVDKKVLRSNRENGRVRTFQFRFNTAIFSW